jgi:RNA polymerase sigma factor (sigma-70 family)
MADADSILLQQAVEGDVVALRSLLERFGGDVRKRIEGRIESRWRSVLDADDVMQVAYLEAFLHIDQLTSRDIASFVSWLSRIAENALRDATRSLARQKRPNPARRVIIPAGADSYAGLLDCLGVTSATPSREASRSDASALLNAAIARLPDDYQAVVRFYDLEGRPVADVAAAMGRSQGAVHMLRARAHDRLRFELGNASQFFSGSA